jgi:TolB-like protein
VLPFDNLSGDPEQEYFADGITEDLITDLSKTSGVFVIARNSSFRYKGVAVDEEIQAMRDRLDATWGTVGINVRTVLAYRPFKEAGDRERFAEGLRRAGQPET